MAENRKVKDPGDEARLAKNGLPPVSADDPIPGDISVEVDELHGTYTTRGKDEYGVERIQVLQVPGHTETGGPPRVPGLKTMAEGLHAAAEARRLTLVQAASEIVPSIDFRGPSEECHYFEHTGGNYEKLGAPTWCQHERCPSWFAEKCVIGKMTEVPMLVRHAQPVDMDEYAKMMATPGASRSPATDDAIKIRADEIGAEKARAEAAVKAEQEARNAEVRRLRKEREAGNGVQFIPAGTDYHAALAAAKRKASGG